MMKGIGSKGLVVLSVSMAIGFAGSSKKAEAAELKEQSSVNVIENQNGGAVVMSAKLVWKTKTEMVKSIEDYMMLHIKSG